MSACLSSSSRAQSEWSPWMAMCSGLSPFLVFAMTGASRSSRWSTTWSWPLLAAQCSGVRPSCIVMHAFKSLITGIRVSIVSVSGWTRGVQVKLWDPLRTRAIPERLRGVFTTSSYTNTRLPYLTLPYNHVGQEKHPQNFWQGRQCKCPSPFLANQQKFNRNK